MKESEEVNQTWRFTYVERRAKKPQLRIFCC
jgi:ribosomal protein L20